VRLDGVPSSIKYNELKDCLSDHGAVRFVEFIRPSARDEAASTTLETVAVGTDAAGGAAAAEKAPTAAAVEIDAAAPASLDAADSAAAAGGVQAAHARFADAEGASACVRELREVEGAAVAATLLMGEEELAFWERCWRQQQRFKGKGKGKKGKGKGKGKKGKGKGKKSSK